MTNFNKLEFSLVNDIPAEQSTPQETSFYMEKGLGNVKQGSKEEVKRRRKGINFFTFGQRAKKMMFRCALVCAEVPF